MRIQRRVRDAKRHELQDLANIETFIDAILNLYPGCPFNTAKSITEHACLKRSRRVGRSAAAKRLVDAAVRLAVVPHVRHVKTNYDKLPTGRLVRFDVRNMVKEQLNSILTKWRSH